MIITRLKTDVKNAREEENLRATVDRQNAMIELLAILVGVDLAEDEVEEGGAVDEGGAADE